MTPKILTISSGYGGQPIEPSTLTALYGSSQKKDKETSALRLNGAVRGATSYSE
jgi:hypothetical protein